LRQVFLASWIKPIQSGLSDYTGRNGVANSAEANNPETFSVFGVFSGKQIQATRLLKPQWQSGFDKQNH
jgi:hypothetical protein